MGRLELPLPEIGKGNTALKKSAADMQARIRLRAPAEVRDSIVVKTFRKGNKTGIAIEYDDRAENYVYLAIEYLAGGKEESVIPRK